MGKQTICIGEKKKAQISFAVTAISAFVFATRIVYFLFYLNILLKFKLLAPFCACTGRLVSDLFGNHIVGFPTRRLKYVLLL